MAFQKVGNSLNISMTAASKSLAFAVGQPQVRVTNSSTTLIAYLAFGVGSATAVIPTSDNTTGADSIAIRPAESAVFDVPLGANYVAVIGSGAGPTIVNFAFGREG